MKSLSIRHRIFVLAAALFTLALVSCWDGFSDYMDSVYESTDTRPEVTLTDSTLTSTGITLRWIEPDKASFSGVRITCAGNGETMESIVGKGTTSYEIKGLSKDEEYAITVKAVYNSQYLSAGISFNVTPTDKPLHFANSAEDLDNVRNNLGGYYILMADIDLSGYSSGTGWTPIGPGYSTPFTGTFDGNGHVVRNLTIDNSAGEFQGLFGVTGAGAVIENLGVENVNIFAKLRIGGLVGRARAGSIIRNCHATGVFKASEESNSEVGGLVGYNEGTIQYSYADVTITNAFSIAGGFVGLNSSGIIEYCYSLGDLPIATLMDGCSHIGGFVGRNVGASGNPGIIQNCYSSGNVSLTSSGSSNIGGFIGSTNYYSTIQYCYAMGNVDAKNNSPFSPSNIGGFAGGIVIDAIISNCYAVGKVNATGTDIHGFLGFAGSPPATTVTSCYYDTSTTGQTDSYYASPLITAQMKDASNFTGWDFAGETSNGTADIWSISPSINDGYPYLTGMAP